MHRGERSLSSHSRVCASALLCIASSRLAAGRLQLIVRLAVASHPYRGGCSRSRHGQAQMHGWSSHFGLRSKAGRRGPVAQWQQPSKRRGVSRPLIGRAKCRCAPQPGQSAARSRLAAGIQSLNPGPLSCAAGIRGAPPKLHHRLLQTCTCIDECVHFSQQQSRRA